MSHTFYVMFYPWYWISWSKFYSWQ